MGEGNMVLLTIQEVNALEQFEDFVQKFGNVVENCPLCASSIWDKRPFRDVEELHRSSCDFLDSLSTVGKQGVLRLYPDLAGRLAEEGKLTSESVNEHRAAGLADLTEVERQTIQSRGREYKAKFGFPFVICARQNKKEAILNGLRKRLEHTTDVELHAGMEEVKKICQLRLMDIVIDNPPSNNKLQGN